MTDQPEVEPLWLDARDMHAVHDRQISQHGGGTGVRDHTLLESALARPQNRWAYGDVEPAALAAAYAFGIARNHPFVDGNKRTAWVAARLFLKINGHKISYTREDAVRVMLALAAGEMSEEELASWFRERIEQAG